jgi:hypothetical protein
LRRFRATIVVVENRKYYMFWVCVCSLNVQCACSVLSSAAYLPLSYSTTWSHNGTIFGGRGVIKLKMCVVIFSANLFDTF